MPQEPQVISAAQLGDMIKERVETNRMDREIYQFIEQYGRVPIKYLFETQDWLIGPSGREGYFNFTQL